MMSKVYFTVHMKKWLPLDEVNKRMAAALGDSTQVREVRATWVNWGWFRLPVLLSVLGSLCWIQRVQLMTWGMWLFNEAQKVIM